MGYPVDIDLEEHRDLVEGVVQSSRESFREFQHEVQDLLP
jgi:hypothetical protein